LDIHPTILLFLSVGSAALREIVFYQTAERSDLRIRRWTVDVQKKRLLIEHLRTGPNRFAASGMAPFCVVVKCPPLVLVDSVDPQMANLLISGWTLMSA
jgi:hypothetical protein